MNSSFPTTKIDQLASRPRVTHRVPPRKKLRSITTDDVLHQLAQDAVNILSHHPLAPPTSLSSSDQLVLDAPESPHSFFKRAGIRSSISFCSKSRTLTSRIRSEPTPPPLPRPCPVKFTHQPNLYCSPSAQPARRRLSPSKSPLTPRLLLTPSTARAAQSLLDLTQ